MTIAPPLADGQLVSLEEFEQRFDATPDLKHAELLDGVAYLRHDGRAFAGSCRAALIGWLGVYSASTRFLLPGAHGHVALDDRNELQPDAILAVRPEAGGTVVLDATGVVRSAPDFAADVFTTTNATLLPKRIAAHERGGTLEYLVWYAEHKCVDWLVRERGEFVAMNPDPADGLLKSVAFPGLWLDATALLNGDLDTVLAALQRGLASAEHKAFVSQLAARRQSP
jgi:hypothetical protein